MESVQDNLCSLNRQLTRKQCTVHETLQDESQSFVYGGSLSA